MLFRAIAEWREEEDGKGFNGCEVVKDERDVRVNKYDATSANNC